MHKTQDSSWAWFANVFNGEEILYGLLVGLEVEFGFFLLKELHSVRYPWGFLIERDLYFETKNLRKTHLPWCNRIFFR
jgi:hypothetical protein